MNLQIRPINGEQDARRWIQLYNRQQQQHNVSAETWIEEFDWLMERLASSSISLAEVM